MTEAPLNRTPASRARAHVRCFAIPRQSAFRLATLLVLILSLAFYLWIADTASITDTGSGFSVSDHNNDVYNLMATSFLRGRTFLPLRPPAGLLHLADPYDPLQNAPYQAAFHDLALKNGHFYSTWGPSPALMFMAFRVTGLRMSQSLAVALFAFAGLLCAVRLLHVLIRRFVPQTPNWTLVVATAGLALTNVAPFLLRRPAQYEVAISGGYFFEMAGVLLVVGAVLRAPASRRRLVLGSLFLGLAVAARPPLAAGGVIALAAGVYLIRKRHQPRRILAAALLPFALCGVALVAYNEVRFGAATEFGQHYQLAGLNVTHKPTDQLAYVPPGVFSYLLIPARLSLTFPHAFLMSTLQYPFHVPNGYAGTPAGGAPEPAGGMLTTMPITLLLLALPVLWWRRRAAESSVLLIATGLTAIALGIIVLLSWALWGTTERYEVDYATYGLLAAFLVWAMLLARAVERRRVRRTAALAGIILTAFGAAVGTAISFTGYYDLFRISYPGVFTTLEAATSPLVTLATLIRNKPELVLVQGPLPVITPTPNYGTINDAGATTWLGSAGPVTVTVVAPHSQDIGLSAVATAGTGAPAITKQFVRVTSPGRRAQIIPLISQYMRFPIHLHLGLNRIRLSLGGTVGTLPEGVLLGNMQLSP